MNNTNQINILHVQSIPTAITDPQQILQTMEADAQSEQANPLPVDNINTNPMEVKQAMNTIIMGHTLPTPEQPTPGLNIPTFTIFTCKLINI